MLKILKEGNGPNARSTSIRDIPNALATHVQFLGWKLTPGESDSTTQCCKQDLYYYLVDLCTCSWPEMANSRFKEYIKNPKENGYQSLHYSSLRDGREPSGHLSCRSGASPCG
jgi:hypothetical protein